MSVTVFKVCYLTVCHKEVHVLDLGVSYARVRYLLALIIGTCT